jgi:hypothetical protein
VCRVSFDGKTKGKAFPHLLFGTVERVSCEAWHGVTGYVTCDKFNDVKEAVGPVLVIEKACKTAVPDVGNPILQ